MRELSRPGLLLACLACAGCLISEQQGEIPADLTFHFGSGFNWAVLLGRSALLAMLALWAFNSEKGASRKVVTMLLGVPAAVAALYFLGHDLPAVRRYRVEVRPASLYLRIPPTAEHEIPWDAIESLRVEGYEWLRGQATPLGKPDFWTQLPEWQTMEIRAEGGRQTVVDLSRLSVEHRQNLWRAIVRRARLRED